jgi:hypothetical protein
LPSGATQLADRMSEAMSSLQSSLQDDQEISCRDSNVIEEIENTSVSPDSQFDGLGSSQFAAGLTERARNIPPVPSSKKTKPSSADTNPRDRYRKDKRHPLPDRFKPDQPIDENNVNVPEINLRDVLDGLGENLVLGGAIQTPDSSLLALGKTSLIMNVDEFAGSSEQIEKKYLAENLPIQDKIKYFNGSFYVLEKNNNLSFFKQGSTRPLIKLKSIHFIGPPSSSIGHTPQQREVYRFSFAKKFDARELVDSTIRGTFLFGGKIPKTSMLETETDVVIDALTDYSADFNDYTFAMPTPFENNETLKNINLIGASVVDVNAEYNFYIKEYEKIATKSNKSSKENIFPNVYLLYSILEENKNDEFLKSMSTLKRTIKSGEKFILNRNIKQLAEAKKSKVILGVKNNVGEYFDNFGLNYDAVNKQNDGLYGSYDKKMKNVVFLVDTTKKLNTINEKKYLFPMNMEFSIPTDKTTNITRMLYDCSLMDNFIIKLFDLANKNTSSRAESVISEKMIDQKVSETISQKTQQPKINFQYSSKRKILNNYRVGEMLDELNQDPIPASDNSHVVIGDTKQYLLSNSASMKFISSLRTKIFQGKLESFIKLNLRTYKDILEGKKAYSETVAFRLSKYIKGQNEPIQNYWIPNNPDLDVLTVVDTQIKYEQEYTYKLSAFQFVLGNDYSHQVIFPNVGEDKDFILLVDQMPDPRIVEVEILSTDKKIVDSPPLSPEIQFVTYRGVDNKIGLFLNGRTGEEKLEPISVLDKDSEKINTYHKTVDNKVIYKSDDVAKRFEIMKMDTKPKSYQDFKNGYVKIAETDINPFTAQSATAASFIDSIEPNKKYYYTFRAVDVHDKISNPSPVYQVEIINDNGTILPIVNNFDFEKPRYQNSLEMRRFIKIKPAVQHTILDKEKSKIDSFQTAQDALGSAILGVSNIGVPWDKTFKIVATSKQTGKKVQIKFKFNYILE